MVKVYESGKFKLYVFPKDHTPAHCHIYSPRKKGYERHAKIAIESLDVLVNEGFSEKEIRLITEFVWKMRKKLMSKWSEYHEE